MTRKNSQFHIVFQVPARRQEKFRLSNVRYSALSESLLSLSFQRRSDRDDLQLEAVRKSGFSEYPYMRLELVSETSDS